MCRGFVAAAKASLRVEGHDSGRVRSTVRRGAAAGVSGDHESMKSADVVGAAWQRYVGTPSPQRVLPNSRRSSRAAPPRAFPERATSQRSGSLPPWMAEHGTIDAASAAMHAGMNPVHAYRCATCGQPAYLRLDQRSRLAPGRLAS